MSCHCKCSVALPQEGSKVKYLNVAITQSVVNIFTEILHADRGTIDMKHIKQDFNSRPGLGPLGGLRGLGRGQNPTFSEYGHVSYQIKGNDT